MSFSVSIPDEMAIYTVKVGAEERLGSILSDTDNFDLRIFGSDGCVRAHRLVFAMASPLLYQVLKDQENGVLLVPDFTKSEIKMIVDFLYTGHALIERKNLSTIGSLGDILGIMGTVMTVIKRNECSHKCHTGLTVTPVPLKIKSIAVDDEDVKVISTSVDNKSPMEKAVNKPSVLNSKSQKPLDNVIEPPLSTTRSSSRQRTPYIPAVIFDDDSSPDDPEPMYDSDPDTLYVPPSEVSSIPPRTGRTRGRPPRTVNTAAPQNQTAVVNPQQSRNMRVSARQSPYARHSVDSDGSSGGRSRSAISPQARDETVQAIAQDRTVATRKSTAVSPARAAVPPYQPTMATAQTAEEAEEEARNESNRYFTPEEMATMENILQKHINDKAVPEREAIEVAARLKRSVKSVTAWFTARHQLANLIRRN